MPAVTFQNSPEQIENKIELSNMDLSLSAFLGS